MVRADSSGARLTAKRLAPPEKESTRSFSSALKSSIEIRRAEPDLKKRMVACAAWDAMPPVALQLKSNRLRSCPRCFDQGFRAQSLRHSSKVHTVRAVDEVHDGEDRERESPAQVRADGLHHGGDSCGDHVVRERQMRQAPPDVACGLALADGYDRGYRSGLSQEQGGGCQDQSQGAGAAMHSRPGGMEYQARQAAGEG